MMNNGMVVVYALSVSALLLWSCGSDPTSNLTTAAISTVTLHVPGMADKLKLL